MLSRRGKSKRKDDASSAALDSDDESVHEKEHSLIGRIRRLSLLHKTKIVLAFLVAFGICCFVFQEQLLEVLSGNDGAGSKTKASRKKKGYMSDISPWALRPEWSRSPLKGTPRHVKDATAKTLKIIMPTQITNPITSIKNSRRTFGCLRDECRGLALEDLNDRTWRMMYKSSKATGGGFKDNLNVKLTLLLTDTTDLAKLKKAHINLYNSVLSAQAGRTYLSAVDGADNIGGNKGLQLRTKINYVKSFKKCTYNSLYIQPAQYRLYVKRECEELLNKAGKSTTFLLKPEVGSQGAGISFHNSPASVQKKAPEFFPCKQNPSMAAGERKLVQEYIDRPLLIHGGKFDCRVYMLVGSTDPWLVFYHQGYLRRSLQQYSASSKKPSVFLTNTHYQSSMQSFKLSDHIWTFQMFQEYLTRTGKAGPHYVESILDPYLKRVSNFIFQSARKKLVRRAGSFQIFGLDFMIDDRFRIHFIEANGYPGYTWSINFDTRGMVSDQFDLIQEIHEAPAAFERMRAGHRYGGFELIFSEIEEEKSGIQYNPCYEFYNNKKTFDTFRTGMRHFAEFTGYPAAKVMVSETQLMDAIGECKSKQCKHARKVANREAGKARRKAERIYEGYQDDVSGTEWIGGSKGSQISALLDSARASGCALNLLGIVPTSYRMYIKEECQRAHKYKTPSKWIAKPLDHTGKRAAGFLFFEHQDDLKNHFGPISACDKLPSEKKKVSTERELFGKASQVHHFIVQKRVNPLMVNKKRWDIRAYMLISRTKPYFVFYHKGYVRNVIFDEDRARLVLEDEALTFEQYQGHLNAEGLTGAHFMENIFSVYAQQVMRAVFDSAYDRLSVGKRKGYQLFEFNFVIDESFTLWLVGVNNNPGFSVTPDLNVQKDMREDMISLILELNDMPEVFTGLRFGDSYGEFKLVWSDYEEEIKNSTMNICKEFKPRWKFSKAELRKANALHGATARKEKANMRELKKYTKMAWEKCRSKYSNEYCRTESKMTRDKFVERYKIYLEKMGKNPLRITEAEIEEYVAQRLMEVSGTLKQNQTNPSN